MFVMGDKVFVDYHTASFVQSFLMRRQFFNHEETGYFRKENQTVPNALSQMGGTFDGSEQ